MREKLIVLILMGCLSIVAMTSDFDYVGLSAKEKQNWLWQKIEASEYNAYPALSSEKWSKIAEIIKQQVMEKDIPEYLYDDVPDVRHRYFFAHGSVAKIEYVPIRKLYSGIFESGALGLVYYSLLADPKSLGSFTPAMAFKFFRDENTSLNLEVLGSWDGQENNHNCFAKRMSNKGASAASVYAKLLAKHFKRKATHALEDLAERLATDKICYEIIAPFQVVLVPTNEARKEIDQNSNNDFRYDLAQMLAESVLYEVHARRSSDSPLMLIGEIKLKSDFIASKFGDHHLIF